MPRAIIGLGNPGRRYAKTRHNAGFMLVDELAGRWQATFRPGRGSYVYARDQKRDVLLVKPTTFMNLSGQAVRHLVDYYKITADDCMLVFDDLDIPFPEIRLRKQGGAGTHRGVQSVIRYLNTPEFPRLRLGIGGSQGSQPAENFVLENYSKDDLKILPEQLITAADAVVHWLEKGIDSAMNRFNVKPATKTVSDESKEEK